MIDRFYMGVMQHLPEVLDEVAEGAVTSASRRHSKWLGAIEKLLAEEVRVREITRTRTC